VRGSLDIFRLGQQDHYNRVVVIFVTGGDSFQGLLLCYVISKCLLKMGFGNDTV
jgi:hypothetical protein